MISSPASVSSTALDALLAENRAHYLPAISNAYSQFVQTGSFPHQLPFAVADLDFLNPASNLFHYPLALYSAGHSSTQEGKPPKPDMVSQRDRSATIVLGDSGGYQVQTGAGSVKFNSDVTPTRMLRWMEQVADWSMVLDFPTGGIASGALQKHIARLQADGHDLEALSHGNGFSVDYNACLLQTKLNNDIFEKERRPGATKLLNVLQGRNETESRYWYEQVKHYPFEGYAFAGSHQNRFSMVVSRLMDMTRDGILQNCDWLHVLGVSTIPVSVLLTVVQRAVRDTVNPHFQITFDSASPFRTAVNSRITVGYTLDAIADKDPWPMHHGNVQSFSRARKDELLEEFCNEQLSFEDKGRFRCRHDANTTIASKVTLADCALSDTGKAVSGGGYQVVMNHNVQAYAKAFRAAHELFFSPDKGDTVLVPESVKSAAAMIDQLLNPRKYVKAWAHWLDATRAD